MFRKGAIKARNPCLSQGTSFDLVTPIEQIQLMNLDRNLNYLLKLNKIKLSDLSVSTKIPKQTLHNWLYGAEPKNILQVKKAAECFKVSIEDLCFSDLEKGSKNKPEDNFKKYHEEINAGVFEVILRRVKSDK